MANISVAPNQQWRYRQRITNNSNAPVDIAIQLDAHLESTGDGINYTPNPIVQSNIQTYESRDFIATVTVPYEAGSYPILRLVSIKPAGAPDSAWAVYPPGAPSGGSPTGDNFVVGVGAFALVFATVEWTPL